MNRRASIGKVFMLLLGVCLVAGTASATNITIWDESGSTDGGVHSNETWAPPSTSAPWEDNEVEPGCETGQSWDLETINAGGGMLTITGGFDFINGNSGVASGDIFIAVGPDGPAFGTGAHALNNPEDYGSAAWHAYNQDIDNYGYSYIIDIDWEGAVGNAAAYQVRQVSSGFDTLVETTEEVTYDQNWESNPYRWLSDNAGFDSVIAGLDGTATVTGGPGAYTASFDVDWLGDLVNISEDIPVWFHFTQECGNDNIMGFSGDPDHFDVPEPASIGLLSLGIMGLMATRMRRKRF